jgi:hypothetical protein
MTILINLQISKTIENILKMSIKSKIIRSKKCNEWGFPFHIYMGEYYILFV